VKEFANHIDLVRMI